MKVVVKKGETLHQALRELNIMQELPCGGNGTCGGCKVEVARFGKVKACQFRIPGAYEVTLPKQRTFHAVGMTPEFSKMPDILEMPGWDDCVSIAADIGTTTVALCGFYRGKQTQRSFTNPQRALGADVMSRIKQAAEGEGEALQELIRTGMEDAAASLVQELCPEADTCRMVIAANTTMIHLLCGWSCEGLGRAPFQPVLLDGQTELWTITQSDGKKIDCKVHILPGISAFIGADIVSGIYAFSMQKETKPMLLLDLGTNGEMALCTAEGIYTASAAAGPAFEGSELSAKIHAAGIMKCLSGLLADGRMDRTGLLSEPEIPVEKDAVITQDDVRDIQMAKAAVRAGIHILLARANVTEAEVEKVYLAGGMGYYMDPKDAVDIGLLPEEFFRKTQPVGNSSLLGAWRSLQEGWETTLFRTEEIRSRSIDIVLANEPDFMDLYIENMNF